MTWSGLQVTEIIIVILCAFLFWNPDLQSKKHEGTNGAFVGVLLHVCSTEKTNQTPLWPVLLSKLTLPLMVLTTDSGCSKISFCMKEL